MKRFQFDSTALRYFLTVVDTGSVNGAAARLNVVSSAVSRQIAGLEQRLHNQLFERHPKGMRVTEVGRILADHARRVEADAARTYAEIDGQNGRYTQTVKIAGAPGFAAYALPRKFAAFQAEHPTIRFKLHILDAGLVAERVRSAQADIGVTYSHTAEKDIAVIYSHPAEIVAVMRPGHPLAASESLHITQLSAYPLALPDGGSALRQVLDMACSLYNITLSPAFTSNLPGAAYHYVQASDAVTLCARLTATEHLESGRLICRPINDALLNAGQLQFQTHASRPLSDAAHRFLRFIRSDAPQLF
ncbi:MAG: LysR family transcriptional regulator [Achromobacter sp.]|jgi:DNA-binding transcriptional LysR family regulator|uniref:HTH-type transcriptional regulator ArgP n=2 Tax=Pseudomonadota TaxID=1224 RepID=A0A6J5H5K2_9BURK|nr:MULTISPECIES: LysR family transcriptional regulator [Achromobacter]MBN9642218.1 LysR family transcriptional regulator [Achromobacter sp.]MCG2604731.1 LysR family transcriptional regulator [Achromobacter sp.]CAB3654402.1 HTH-type transcriptional regulator ArgP [Achromobacter insuavis]CAB3814391.1 HTH-type transcriptional regulator ArgP [Achromobacter insuavis]CUJ51071.1 CysJI operon transcriptional activator [Achromobacter sp. 2789STDY5608621]